MVDLQHEQALTLNEARRLPFLKGRSGNHISLCTLNRWRVRGVGGVVLETAKCGGTVVTTIEAVLRFIERLSNLSDAVTTNTRPTIQRRRDIAKAQKRLDDVGIV